MPNPVVRARDLRINIKELGFEKGVVYTLELLLDEQTGMRQTLRDLTALLSQCVDQVDRMVSVGKSMSDALDLLKREQADDRTDHNG